MVLSNLTAARLPKKVLLNTTKVTLWATKYEWNFPTVADALLGALMIPVLVSDAVKLAIGPGNALVYNRVLLEVLLTKWG